VGRFYRSGTQRPALGVGNGLAKAHRLSSRGCCWAVCLGDGRVPKVVGPSVWRNPAGPRSEINTIREQPIRTTSTGGRPILWRSCRWAFVTSSRSPRRPPFQSTLRMGNSIQKGEIGAFKWPFAPPSAHGKRWPSPPASRSTRAAVPGHWPCSPDRLPPE